MQSKYKHNEWKKVKPKHKLKGKKEKGESKRGSYVKVEGKDKSG